MKLVKDLDTTDRTVLKFLLEGNGAIEIARKMWPIKLNTVHQRLHRIRVFYGVATNIELVVKINRIRKLTGSINPNQLRLCLTGT